MVGLLSAESANASLNPDSVERSDVGGRVAILMCTYNGERFLSEQLASIQQQDYSNWVLYVSDDGSTDSTLEITKAFQARLGLEKVKLLSGPGCGFASNFMSLTCHQDASADFYAWSDQDDIWAADKLKAALTWLNKMPKDIPALYSSRTTLVDEAGNHTGLTSRFSGAFGFSNALVENVAAGNTMVFNHAARELLQSAGQQDNIVAHDWWAYMLVTGAGGRFFYDTTPHIFYRQHPLNSIGAAIGLKAALVRIHKLFQGRLSRWIDQNIANLDAIDYLLTETNREVLQRFKSARARNLPGRVIGIWRSGIYRQTFMGNVGLLVAAIFKGV
ncbi:glycosyltransferase family 2 protein [Pseudomonas sp. 5S1]|nr:glycosyltransferase family 2 protein [Pseudomonas sp. 5S1]